MTRLLLLALLAGSPALAQEMPNEPAPLSELVGIDGVSPATPPPSPAQVDALTHDIASELRCPVCQGLSVADSQAETAVAMFERIRELVRLGYTEEQIDAYFITRYGEWVLLAPPATGLGLWLWVLPALLLLGGLFAVFALVGRQRSAPAAPAPSQTDDDPYVKRVLADLEDV